jgi:eukaryotic-like serine/threonine-protein kinase
VEQMGRYRLIRRLAAGGMAEVFLSKVAGPRGFEKVVVVKRILPHLAEDPQFVDMFLTEAKLAALLEHPNLVHIFDFGVEEGAYFLAMEYVDGPNLRTLSKRTLQEAGPLPLELCARIVSLACEGLAYAHELVDTRTGKPLGLLHRDISTDNILVSRAGAVKVVDFGIAKAASVGQRTQSGVLKGKVAYMAPEYLLGEPVDARSDLYALGVVLYELVAGRKPFEAESDGRLMRAILHEPLVDIRELRPEVPEALAGIVNKALAREPQERYPSCRALQAELESFLFQTGQQVGTQQVAQRVRALFPVLPVDELSGETLSVPTAPAPASATQQLPSQPSQAPAGAREPAREDSQSQARSPADSWRSRRNRTLTVGGGLVLALSLAGYGVWQASRTQGSPPPAQAQAAMPSEPVLEAEPQAQGGGAQGPVAPSSPEGQVEPVEESGSGGEVPEAAPQGGATPAVTRQTVTAAHAVLKLACDLRADVHINGRPVGRTPLARSVPPGQVRIEFSGTGSSGRFDKSVSLRLQAGEERQVPCSIQRMPVTIRGRPDDMKVLSVDGRPQTSTEGVLLYEGTHRLELLHSHTGQRYTSECIARPGDKLCRFFVQVGE